MIQSTHWSQLKPLWRRSFYWWSKPAEYSDLNPIDNLCYKLKNYIYKTVKPASNNKLVNGIQEFLNTVSTQWNVSAVLDIWRRLSARSFNVKVLPMDIKIIWMFWYIDWLWKEIREPVLQFKKHLNMFCEFCEVFMVIKRRWGSLPSVKKKNI